MALRLFFFSSSCSGVCKNHSLHYLILPCILIQWPHLIYVFALVFILNRARSLKWLSLRFSVGHTKYMQFFFCSFVVLLLDLLCIRLSIFFVFMYVFKLKPVVEWLPNALTGLVFVAKYVFFVWRRKSVGLLSALFSFRIKSHRRVFWLFSAFLVVQRRLCGAARIWI